MFSNILIVKFHCNLTIKILKYHICIKEDYKKLFPIFMIAIKI